jgi:hypothetical protein
MTFLSLVKGDLIRKKSRGLCAKNNYLENRRKDKVKRWVKMIQS